MADRLADRSRIKLSRAYLEEVWLPRLGASPPVLDVGKAGYTEDYAARAGTSSYVTVDVDATRGPDIVADATSPELVERAAERFAEYGAVLFNGVIGYGVDTMAQVSACLRGFHALLRSGGLLLVGWNEWDIDRVSLGAALRELGFENEPIEGQEVFSPPETAGYERLKHRYTLWRKA